MTENLILNLDRYQRAYVDFFEDQLVLSGYDWKKVLGEYLFTGKAPLINCLIGGRMYPILPAIIYSTRTSHSGTPSHSPWLRLRDLLSRIGNGSPRSCHHLV